MADPYFSSVVLLLKFNETVGGTATTDFSDTGRTMTFQGAAEIAAADAAEGNALSLPTTVSYLDTPTHSDFHFAAGDFTIEYWAAFDSATNDQVVIGMADSTSDIGWYIRWRFGGWEFVWTTDGSTFQNRDSGSTGLLQATQHWCVQRSGTTLSFWKNGTLVDEGAYMGTDNIHNSGAKMLVGGKLVSGALDDPCIGGYDSIRVTKGVARYTTGVNLTVPDPDFPESGAGVGDGNHARSTVLGQSTLSSIVPPARTTQIGQSTLNSIVPPARTTQIGQSTLSTLNAPTRTTQTAMSILHGIDVRKVPKSQVHVIHGKQPTVDGVFEAFVPAPPPFDIWWYPGSRMPHDWTNDRYMVAGVPYGSFGAIPGASVAVDADGTYRNSSQFIVPATLNTPRLDYSKGGMRSLLRDPTRENILTYSADFSNASWNKQVSSVIADAASGPDGFTSMDKLVALAGVGDHYMRRSTSASINTSYVYSIFAKAGEIDIIALRTGQVTGNPYAWFDLTLGNVGTIDAELDDAVIENWGGGIYRCAIMWSTAGTINNNLLDTNLAVVDGASGYDESANPGGAYVFGAQYEEGVYMSSYVPTTGSAVTRDADVYWHPASDPGAVCTLLLDCFIGNTDDATPALYSISDGTTDNWCGFYYLKATEKIYAKVVSGGVTVFDEIIIPAVAIGDRVRMAMRVKANDFSAIATGETKATDSSGALPISPNKYALSGALGTDEMTCHYVYDDMIVAGWSDAAQETWVNEI